MDACGFIRLLKINDVNSEVWWDSSPAVYETFRRHMLEKYPELPGFINDLLPAQLTEHSLGINNVTTNPRLIAQAVVEHAPQWHAYTDCLPDAFSASDKARRVYDQVIEDGANQLRPLWLSSQRRHGWLSAQIEGGERMTAGALVARGLELASLAPNIMIKVPGSEQGYSAIEQLVAEGCSINNTFCFTVSQAAACLKAIHRGRLRASAAGVSTEHARYVISFMIGRLGAEAEFERQAAGVHASLNADAKRWAELAVYQAIQALLRRSGTSARLLLCSVKIHTDAKGCEQCWHLQRTGFGPTLYTLTPQIIEFLIRRQHQRRPIKPASDWVQVPKELMTTLTAIPYFYQAYFEGTLAPSEFARHPAFITASHDAREGEERLLAFVQGASDIPDGLPIRSRREPMMEHLS